MFLLDFSTYLYKVTNIWTKEIKTFKFLHDFESWIDGSLASEWKIRYFKGLATSDPDAVEDYFENIEKHRRYFLWSSQIDGNYIERAFSNGTVNDRRTWIIEYEEGLYVTTMSNPTISYSDFIKKELVLYFMESNKRSFPSIMDGLKVSSRKIMFALMERDEPRKRRLIEGLASFVSDVAVYHHGLESLEHTIFLMGQDFIGKNSLKLLKSDCLYGSRFDGGKGIAARYLDVEIAPIADFIFPKEDFQFLTYMREDGKRVQPQWYAPIIPLALVNGCQGIGSGYRTTIYNYSITGIIENLRRLMHNEENNEGKLPLLDMLPSYPGYKGSIEKGNDNSYNVLGKWCFDEGDNTKLTIEEIPFSILYEDYEKRLVRLKDEGTIKGFTRNGSKTSYCWYTVLLTDSLPENVLCKKFCLTETIHPDINLYDAKGILQYYSGPEKVVEEFFY